MNAKYQASRQAFVQKFRNYDGNTWRNTHDLSWVAWKAWQSGAKWQERQIQKSLVEIKNRLKTVEGNLSMAMQLRQNERTK